VVAHDDVGVQVSGDAEAALEGPAHVGHECALVGDLLLVTVAVHATEGPGVVRELRAGVRQGAPHCEQASDSIVAETAVWLRREGCRIRVERIDFLSAGHGFVTRELDAGERTDQQQNHQNSHRQATETGVLQNGFAGTGHGDLSERVGDPATIWSRRIDYARDVKRVR